jgi:hypothetical protein
MYIFVAEGFADEGDELFAASDGSFGVAHATAELKLDGLRFGDGEVALQMLNGLFGRDVALAVGLVDGDLLVMNVADQLSDGLAGHAAEHVQNGKLDGCEWNEDGEAGRLVVALIDRDLFEQCFQIAGILADEEGLHALYEDGVERLHLHSVGDGDALGSALRAHAAEKAVFVAKQLQRFDNDGRGKELTLEDGFAECFVELCVIRVGPRRVAGLSLALRRRRESSCRTGGDGGSKNVATGRLHD